MLNKLRNLIRFAFRQDDVNAALNRLADDFRLLEPAKGPSDYHLSLTAFTSNRLRQIFGLYKEDVNVEKGVLTIKYKYIPFPKKGNVERNRSPDTAIIMMALANEYFKDHLPSVRYATLEIAAFRKDFPISVANGYTYNLTVKEGGEVWHFRDREAKDLLTCIESTPLHWIAQDVFEVELISKKMVSEALDGFYPPSKAQEG